MTAAQPIAVLRGSAPDIEHRPRAHRPLRAGWRLSVHDRRHVRADIDRLRHGRLAGPHRRRVHVRQRPPLRRRRRPLRRRAGRQRQGRGRRLRPAVRLGALRRGRRRGPARPRHPGRPRRPRGPDPDELVRGRQRGARRRASSSRPATTRGSTTASRSRPRPGPRPAPRSWRVIEARLAVNGGQPIDRRPARRRRELPGSSSGSIRSTATSSSCGGRSTSMRSGRRTCRSSSTRCRAPGPAGSAGCSAAVASGSDEIHQERNPYFGGVNPEPIRPNIDEALRSHGRGRPRPGAAARRRRRPGGRGGRDGHVHPPAPGHRPADVLPRRAPRLARSGRRQRQQHVDGRPPRRALRHRDLRDAGRVQVHRPEDDRDRRDDGRRGVGRVRLRDAPARSATGSTPTCCCSTCSCASERPGAGRCRARWPHFHESPGRRSIAASTSTSTRAEYPEVKRRLLVDLAARAPTELAGQPVARTVALDTGDGFKFFLADGSWLLIRASGTEPLVRVYTEATSADARDALLVAGERWSAARERRRCRARVDKPWGHELIWAHTDRYVGKILVIETGRRLSLQRHEVKDEIDPRPLGPAAAVPRGRRRRRPRRRARAGRAPPRRHRPDPSLRGHRAVRAHRGLDARARRRRPARGRLRPRGDERALIREGRLRG